MASVNVGLYSAVNMMRGAVLGLEMSAERGIRYENRDSSDVPPAEWEGTLSALKLKRANAIR